MAGLALSLYVNGKKNGNGRLKFYDIYYYCGNCGEKILQSEARKDVNGFPICPTCGSRVRIKPKHYKRKVKHDLSQL